MTSARNAKARIVEMMASTVVLTFREQWGDGAAMEQFRRVILKPGNAAKALRAASAEAARSPDPSGWMLDRMLREAEIDMDKQDDIP